MRNNKIIITVDYETWQPVPENKEINWEKDVLSPANELMDACEKSGAKLTFFIEMCEVIWLEKNEPSIYAQIKDQIKDIINRGHDVQLHMHPNWLPELGAKKNENVYEWNWDYIHLDACPNDISILIKDCKEKLESIVHEINATYKVRAFRAGGYRIQPFEKIRKALIENQIFIDTSVYMGGISDDRGYDFTGCKSYTRPYKAGEHDPCIEQSEDKECVIELPITSYKNGERLFIDNEESENIGRRYIGMPKEAFEGENNFFTLIGHTKADHNFIALSDQLEIVGGDLEQGLSQYQRVMRKL